MPEKTISCGPSHRTLTEVRDRAGRLAAAFAELGLQRGDRYAILMRNDIAFLEATMAGAPIGAVPVPINWHWTGDDLRHVLRDSGCRLVVAHTELLGPVAAADVDPLAVVEAELPPDLADVLGLTPVGPTGRYPTMTDLLASHEPISATVTDPPLGVIYTSGTTGTPKGILRQPIPPADFQAIARSLFVFFGMDPTMSTLVAAPLYHTAPNTHALVAAALGMDVQILPRFDPHAFLETVQDQQIQHAQMVPIMFVRLLKLSVEERARYDISSLRAVVHAAAPCPPEIKRAMIDWWGPIIWEYYGGSETGAVVGCDSTEWLAHPGTVGTPRLSTDARILDPLGQEVPVGEVGEVFVKPLDAWPDFTYIGRDDKRREIERDGYFTVGDVGRLDEDGFLYLSDRLHDMVISGGVNIYPAEIESCLITMPEIADVAVFGVPDDEFGEAIVAHVQTAPGAQLTADDVCAFVRGHLAGYKVPRSVVFEETLPRDPAGKLFKRLLKQQYAGSASAGSASLSGSTAT